MAYLQEEPFQVHIIDDRGEYHSVDIMAADVREKEQAITFYDRWGNVVASFKKIYTIGFSKKEKK